MAHLMEQFPNPALQQIEMSVPSVLLCVTEDELEFSTIQLYFKFYFQCFIYILVSVYCCITEVFNYGHNWRKSLLEIKHMFIY
jgi:hypothetical protein